MQNIGRQMRDVLAYGGPDDAGEFTSDGVYLGHRRLAIIDVSAAGHQPMHFNDWVIVFNGEIYNHAEIAAELEQAGYQFNSHSDTEVILKAFDLWSYRAVDKFRGMFAFALWHKVTKKLIICRDRVGVKPLYWYKKDDVFLFGSELKALRQYPGFDTEIDHQAVSLFLQTGYISSPYSIYKHAKKLTPGSFLEVDATGEIKTWKYWDVTTINTDYTDVADEAVIQKAEAIITESCRLRMVADVPVGVFLSGGIDSSLVTAVLQKNNAQKIKTFTIGFEDAEYDESVHAKAVSKFLGTDHHEYKCSERDFLEVIDKLPDMYDEPFGDSSAIPTHLVAKMAREQVTVALSADGGDEVFAGYDRYQITKNTYKKINRLPLLLRKLAAGGILKTNPKYIGKVFKGLRINSRGLEWRLPKLANVLTADTVVDFYEKSMSNVSLTLLNQLHTVPHQQLFDEGFAIEEEKDNLFSLLGKADVMTYLEGDILTKVDRATMQVALEGREPLLDHKIIEFGLALPDHFKIRNGKGKWVLRELLYKYVPAELVDRPKQGFGIPIKAWLKNNLKDYMLQIIDDEKFIETFRFDNKRLTNVIYTFYNSDRPSTNPYFVWSLYNLYKWYIKWMV